MNCLSPGVDESQSRVCRVKPLNEFAFFAKEIKVMKRSRRTRRDFLQAGLGLTAAALAPIAAGPAHAADSSTLERLRRRERDPNRRVLFKGGTVISIDAKTGDHLRADVLV